MKKFNSTKASFKQNSFITRYCLAVVVMLALLGPLAQNGRCDFILLNDEELTVNSFYNQGTLFDTSRVFIVPGGQVDYLEAFNSSTANIAGGAVGQFLIARNYSTVNISGGPSVVSLLEAWGSSTVNISGSGSMSCDIRAWDSSTVNISGGQVLYLHARYSSAVNISGGSMNNFEAFDSSVVTFHGLNFSASGGLILDGERVLGRGILSGEWMDGTQWAVNISNNAPTATILAIPEPATLLLLGLGFLMMKRKGRTE